jgi:uncharacterized protein involved in exopolysaccharide biosynthesis
MRRYRWLLGCTVLGVAAGFAGAFLRQDRFTSRTTLQVVPAQLPERYVPGIPVLDAGKFVRRHAQLMVSRARLTNLIQSLDLYPSERSRQPMEDVIEIMRLDTRLLAPSDGNIEIAFTYQDRYKAQRVAATMASTMIDQSIREAAISFQGTHQFMTDQVDRAAASWTKLNDQLKASGKPDERLIMDRDLARTQYLDLKAKLAEADMVADLGRYHYGPSLELLEGASLPTRSDVNRALWVGGGTFIGLLLGLVLHFARHARVLGFPRPALAV